MPIYEYVCEACDERFERYVPAFTDTPACPSCRAERVSRQLSSFAVAVSSSGPTPSPRPSSGGGCCGGGCGCSH